MLATANKLADKDPATYIQEKQVMLSGLVPIRLEPALITLDDVIGSLRFGEYR